MNFRSVAMTLFSAALLLACSQVRADNFQSFGDYEIHYNAFTSDFLSPQVAQTYKVQRSKNRGVLVISVLKKVMGTAGQAVSGIIRVTANNLTGQLRTLDVRKVSEGNAIYYLSTFAVNNEETLDFNIQVTPEGRDAPYEAKFRQQFFTE